MEKQNTCLIFIISLLGMLVCCRGTYVLSPSELRDQESVCAASASGTVTNPEGDKQSLLCNRGFVQSDHKTNVYYLNVNFEKDIQDPNSALYEVERFLQIRAREKFLKRYLLPFMIFLCINVLLILIYLTVVYSQDSMPPVTSMPDVIVVDDSDLVCLISEDPSTLIGAPSDILNSPEEMVSPQVNIEDARIEI
ncbi:hypothetical protein NEFER03_1178 [Nematocida sp. LUAm3]|nr:hypothetical protein NEFER03_1178 [Nematocida sp. LUAm3]KAI5175787.1 hypothetical protein NEFER02_1656 [Nematocida sp. LUAm2]KAI5178283.1 hypothetical protein NEFER01_1450 [Nematocida sp. LUAm1]